MQTNRYQSLSFSLAMMLKTALRTSGNATRLQIQLLTNKRNQDPQDRTTTIREYGDNKRFLGHRKNQYQNKKEMVDPKTEEGGNEVNLPTIDKAKVDVSSFDKYLPVIIASLEQNVQTFKAGNIANFLPKWRSITTGH